MRADVAMRSPDLLDAVVQIVGDDPFDRLDDGTRFAQPALYCASIASWEAAGRPGSSFIAGHSLGEVAALVAAGAITVRDGLRLSIARGELMQRAAESVGPGGMMAILGNGEAARELAERSGLTVANDNAPGQVVLSGAADSLRAAARSAKEAGLRVVRLPIQGAFHSPAMRSAVPAFRALLSSIEFRSPSVPVFSSITGQPFENAREQLADALVLPVRWRDTLAELHRRGARRFVEAGPGKVLTRLVERNLSGVQALALAELEPEVVHA